MRSAAPQVLAAPGLLALFLGFCGCDGGPELERFTSPLCSSTPFLDLEGFEPTFAADYVELRSYVDYAPAQTLKILSTRGNKCSGASFPEGCVSALSTLHSGIGVRATCTRDDDRCTFYYLATSIGNAVGRINSQSTFHDYLGVISSPQAALWAAWSAGYDIDCTDKAGGAVRAVVGGFEVIATRPFGCLAHTQYVLFVNGRSAVVERSARIVDEPSEGPCRIL